MADAVIKAEKKVWNHGKVPSLGSETRGFYLILGPRELSAAYRYTTKRDCPAIYHQTVLLFYW